MSEQMPASAIEWNNFFNVASTIAIVALAIVVAAMIYFVVMYREKKGQPEFTPEKHLSKTRPRDAVIFATSHHNLV